MTDTSGYQTTDSSPTPRSVVYVFPGVKEAHTITLNFQCGARNQIARLLSQREAVSLRDPSAALFWWIFLSRYKSWISVCIFYESWCKIFTDSSTKMRIFNFVLTHLINSYLSAAILKLYPDSVITTTALFAFHSSAIYCTSLPFYTSQTTAC